MKWADLDRYDYTLPSELIRKTPLEPRDGTRLFVYDTATDTVRFDSFRNLAAYLPERSLMVLNDTQVRPARLWLRKPTGGKIEVLVLVNEWDGCSPIPALVDRKVSVRDRLSFPNGDGLIAERQAEQKFFFRLESSRSLFDLLDTFGETPIPHYLESETKPDEKLLRARYQTTFAARGASVAAPTASLHFTDAVFASLETKGIDQTRITLDVGQGTFAPLQEENLVSGKLHPERVTVSEQAAEEITLAKAKRRPIIAVGTTVTRSLESLSRTGSVPAGTFSVNIFITPAYQFQMADILITNFHLPRTSLMLLVDAFLRSKGAKRGVMDLYAIAIEERFSFYSFGDSMLIL